MKNFKLLIFLFCIFFSNFSSSLYLFEYYPVLKEKLPHISLCNLPTPIIKLDSFASELAEKIEREKILDGEGKNCDKKNIVCENIACKNGASKNCEGFTKNIYMKEDYLTGKILPDGSQLYGGNKPRKLEFLLADAKSKGKETIITYGCAGSNHALATAVYAQELGFKNCILMLKNQPNSSVVRHNLLLDVYCGAQLQFYPDNKTRNVASSEILKYDEKAYLIPTGGSNAIGAIGFVEAAFELREQIKAGLMPEPDFIYLPIGSCGTAAGLLLGLQASGLKSKVVAVGVEPEEIKDEYYIFTKKNFMRANELLNSLDQEFKIFEFPEDKFIINKKFAGKEYGLFTQEALQAIRFFKGTENILLEGTYSAKPIAAIMDDYAIGALKDEVVLFWNTYCATDYSEYTRNIDYKEMPIEFHKYFEQDVQRVF